MADPFSTGDVGTFVGTVVDERVNPLIWYGLKWGLDGAGNSAHLTYSFPTYNAAWLSNYYDQEPFQNFQPFTAAQQTAAKKALGLWAEVANVTFEQVTETATNVGEIRFANSGAVTNSSSAAWAYGPYEQPGEAWPENGDVWFDKAYSYNLQLQPGQFGFATMLHEIGHALGLDHPFADTSDPSEPVLKINWDNDVYTVMSYEANSDTTAYASTPQVLDILAIQYMYGANMTTRTGNDTYKFGAAEVSKTIWDAGGIDTLDFSNQRNGVTGELAEGTYFRFGGTTFQTTSFVGIAYGVTIENVIGSNGNNWLSGNSAANRIVGGNSWDVLYGFEGNDTIIGGGGNDSISGMEGDDFFDAGSGEDMVEGRDGNDTILGGSGNDISLWGDVGDDFIDGGAGADGLVSGDEGNDTLIGGTGNDSLRGGEGNDLYEIDAAGDVIDEQTNVDTDDVVRSSIVVNLSTLGAGQIEHAILLGAAAINAFGNDKNNELTGNAGANVLDGKIGADILSGGKGADTYIVDEAGDQVNETIGGTTGGIDLVKAGLTYSLADLGNVENLTLTGLGDFGATGNGLKNVLIGNDGANRLDGGLGSDTMTGGKGGDTYVVNVAGDVVNETVLNNKGGGVDTVESAITYSLATRTNIENLTLTGGLDINGTGNALANTIIGNTGKNILDGGVGADKLEGGAGNDTYIFDNLGDTADEEANTDSADLLKTGVLIAVGIAGIENYTYTGAKAWTFTGTTADNKITGSSVNDSLNGGDGNDTLLGNGGNDVLFGEIGDDLLDGGVGNDKMKGGAGNDTYVISALTDVVDEEGKADTDDWIKSSVSVSLLSAAFLDIEHVELAGTAAKATGDTGDNKLTGNAAANVLDGGIGADTLIGGKGADTYFVDNAGDKVTEDTAGAAGGIDLVTSSISYTLGDNLEKLTLAVGAGSIDATGNALNNTLLGNEGANILDGLGGSDTMTGGKGDDTYVVDKAGDVVNETIAAGGGKDEVESFITFTLATRVNVENLTLKGADHINGTGNALNNEIIGNSGNNVLNGGTGNDTLQGGDGNDKLTGGTGSDTFDFNLVSELGDLDTVGDFTKGAGGDKLDISDLLNDAGYAGSDVFADGYVSLTYVGATTQVMFDSNGGADSGLLLASLTNVTLTSSNLENFTFNYTV